MFFFEKLFNLNPSTKYLIHCVSLVSILLFYIHQFLSVKSSNPNKDFDPFLKYGRWTYVLAFFRVLILLVFPQILFNFFGLILYNPFKEDVFLKEGAQNAPFICFRVVTRGDYPKLVDSNVKRNLKTCLNVGLENFVFEIATDQPLNLTCNQNKVRQILIPKDYETKTGALFKSRALQYCLEDHVNQLKETDWIVHLDEETIMTENSVRGILNFVSKNKHEIGQGVITYANEKVENWITTLADNVRVAEDFGKIKFQFLLFHRPFFGYKGSYVVCKYKTEKEVTFDHGLDGSVAEDAYFSMIAFKKGFSFDFIDGEMWEKSPFSILDFIKQRKRWIQGFYLVVHSKNIPIKNKLLLTMSLYGWLTLPITTSNIIWTYFFPLPPSFLLPFNLMLAFGAGLNTYMYLFGVVKSFSLKRIGICKFLFFLICSLFTIPINLILENIAVCWSLISDKYKFYVVRKA